jgi:hypothetical protein
METKQTAFENSVQDNVPSVPVKRNKSQILALLGSKFKSNHQDSHSSSSSSVSRGILSTETTSVLGCFTIEGRTASHVQTTVLGTDDNVETGLNNCLCSKGSNANKAI